VTLGLVKLGKKNSSLSKLWTARHLFKDQGMNAVIEREQAEA